MESGHYSYPTVFSGLDDVYCVTDQNIYEAVTSSLLELAPSSSSNEIADHEEWLPQLKQKELSRTMRSCSIVIKGYPIQALSHLWLGTNSVSTEWLNKAPFSCAFVAASKFGSSSRLDPGARLVRALATVIASCND